MVEFFITLICLVVAIINNSYGWAIAAGLFAIANNISYYTNKVKGD